MDERLEKRIVEEAIRIQEKLDAASPGKRSLLTVKSWLVILNVAFPIVIPSIVAFFLFILFLLGGGYILRLIGGPPLAHKVSGVAVWVCLGLAMAVAVILLHRNIKLGEFVHDFVHDSTDEKE